MIALKQKTILLLKIFLKRKTRYINILLRQMQIIFFYKLEDKADLNGI